MHINIYSQELTREVVLVQNVSENGIKHFGVRFFLASPDILHHTPDYDDRSAVTFWLPNCGSFTALDLGRLLEEGAALIIDRPNQ